MDFRKRLALYGLCLSAFLLLASIPCHAAPGCTTVAGVTTCTGDDSTSISNGAVGSTYVTASTYPSTLSVSGLSGTIATIKVQLNGLTSNDVVGCGTADLQVLLKSPTGQYMEVMGDAGNCDATTGEDWTSGGVTLTIQDGGTAMPYSGDSPCNSSTAGWPYPTESGGFNEGTFAPTSCPYGNNPEVYPSPGPGTITATGDLAAPVGTATLNGTFDNLDPNGTWSLYLVDNDGQFAGSDDISLTGWSLIFTLNASESSTTTSLSSNNNPSFSSGSNSSVTLTATVSPAPGGGTVTFKDGTNTISCSGGDQTVNGSGQATCTVTFGTQGNHVLTAVYSGSGSYAGSTSSPLNQFVETPTSGTYCNTGGITMPGVDDTSPYPSVINVSGISNAVSTVSLTLTGFSWTESALGVHMLLVSPGNNALEFFSAGESASGNYTFTDDGAQVPENGDPIPAGSYQPTVFSISGMTDVFTPQPPAPAPQVPGTFNVAAPAGDPNAGTFESTFNGATANGAWSLFVYDDAGAGASGSITGGWCIDITQASGAATTTSVSASPNPARISSGVTSVTVTATVKSGGNAVTAGTVTFTENGQNVAGGPTSAVALNSSGQASFTTTSLPEGDHKIVATYSGVADTYALSFGSLTQRVDSATTVTQNSGVLSFCNPGKITIPNPSNPIDEGAATPNPSNIFVANAPGTINHVTVTLDGVQLSTPYYLTSLLVGPLNTAANSLDFFSDVGGSTPMSSGVNLTLEDSAASNLGTGDTGSALTTGSFKPTSGPLGGLRGSADTFSSTDSFYSPPAGPYPYAAPAGSSTFGDVFTNGQNPNGTWSLYLNQYSEATGSSIGSWCVNITPNPVTVGVVESHTGSGAGGDFVQGEQGANLTTVITNNGTGPTGDPSGTNPLKVTDTLNSAFTYTGSSGSGWSCSASGQTVTCTNDSAVAQGDPYPTLTLNVNVSGTATGSVSNQASVSGAGVTAANSNADSITIIAAPVLAVAKSHTGTFTQGQTATWSIVVSNTAAGSVTDGTVMVSDSLPSGYTVNGASGTNWSCGGTGTDTLTCSDTTDAVAGGSNFNAITLTVNVPANSPTSVSNTATAYGGGDIVHTNSGNAASGSDSDVPVVQVPASISATGGALQSATVSTAFGTALQATVLDAGGQPVSGVSVTFTAPAGGPSGAFSSTGATDTETTGLNGVATTSQTFTANATAGYDPVTATASGVTSPAPFGLYNLPSGSNPAAAWGYNPYGQLGNNSTTDSHTPVQVSNLTGVVAVASQGNALYSLALKSDGTVWAWGLNSNGQLGNGTITNSSTPVQVSGLTNVVAIAGGGAHSLALKSDGTVWAWGLNSNGQLGNGTTTDSHTPVQVEGPGGTGDLMGVVAIAGGSDHSLALKSDGTAWAWGYNSNGELGNNSTTGSNTPVQVEGPGGTGYLMGVVAIAGGSSHSLALKSDGTVWAWGYNYDGELGNGTTTTTSPYGSSTPVQVLGLGGSGFFTGVAIAAGGDHSLALKGDGTVWAWGDNADGDLGNNSTTESNTPVQTIGLTGAAGIAGGYEHSLAIGTAGATHFSVTATSPQTAGTAFDVTVTALDYNNNTFPGYTGTVQITSSDGAAILPPNAMLTSGVGTFSITLKTAGPQTITATDTVISTLTGTSSPITVNPLSATQLAVSATSPQTAGSPFSFTVTAQDTYGNTTGYTGTVKFTSSDTGTGVTLPGNYTFVPGDNGVHTFTSGATLVTAGLQTITATDTVTSTITGTTSPITVNAAGATHFTVMATSPQTAGSPFSFTVTALDPDGNIATGYTGTVKFSKSDSGAGSAVPTNYTFTGTGGDAGVHTFTSGATLVTAGPQTITATDTLTSTITGTTSPITVNPAGAKTLTVSVTSPETAGSPFTVTVKAVDPYGNTATGYTGMVKFTTSDAGTGVVLPANYPFTGGDAGVHSFTNGATLVTAGPQTITATDTVTSPITGTTSPITVNPAGATHFTVSATSPQTAGSPFNFTVTALDQFNNTATGYAGMVKFSSSDGAAILPVNSVLTSGTKMFSATLFTAGLQSITATDTVTSAITGISSPITVNPGPANHLAVVAPPTAVPGTPFNFTVTALDLYSNVVTTYLGTVKFTSSDGAATLPGNYTFNGGDSGIHTFSATLSTGGTQTITATDTVNSAITGTSGPIVTSATAAFINTDKTTQGNWMGVYGADGYDVANGPQYPSGGTLSYGTYALQGQQNWTWAPTTTDPRGLEIDSVGDRTGATWYKPTSFSFDVNLTGGQHQVALYVVDWDSQSRAETIVVKDFNTGNVLDTRSIPNSDTNTVGSNFVGGSYLVWNISGHVTITITTNAGPNCVVSGIFFGGKSVVVAPPTAVYTGSDTTTQGNWLGTYGSDGYWVANGGESLPTYDPTLTIKGENTWTWAANPTDPRAPETGTDGTSVRTASTWYSGTSFSFDVNIISGTHQVALYLLDWDSQGRGETVQISDASAGTVLDTRVIPDSSVDATNTNTTGANFVGGTYLAWNITGHVTITVTRNAGPNGVVSGIFFGGSGTPPPPPPPPPTAAATWLQSDTSTQGAWIGKYGTQGYSLANASQSFSIPATLLVENQQNWTWAVDPTPADPRDLQTDTHGDTLAAAWYSPTTFNMDLNLTDGAAHNVELYVMDWDSKGRTETLQIKDANSGTVLDTRIIPSTTGTSSTGTTGANFVNGTYVIWTITGHVSISVTADTGPNAVVSGVFIDP